jgi:hypothetical protein
LGLGIFIFIVVKAAIVQITVDEAYTLTILTKESVWDLVSYKESYTNNHILHSLLCKLSFAIFGMDQVAGRLPNLLSFVLYFSFVWRYSRRFFTDDFVGFMFVAVMVGNPYMLDFFSLARGYGLSISLMMTSIYFATRYVVESDKRSLAMSQLFAILSVYAQFALLHFYLGLNFLIFLFEVQKYINSKNKSNLLRGVSIQFLSFIVLGILVYAPFKAILKDNQISYYGSKNIWDDSLVSLISGSLYAQGYFSGATVIVFKNLMVVLFILLFINFFQEILKGKAVPIKNNNQNSSSGIDKQNSPTLSLFAFGLLLSIVFVIVVQFYVFGTQYVVDRTSLFLYPIIALNIPTLATFFGQKKQWVGRFVAVLFTVFCTWHIVRSANLINFQEWWFDKNTLEVIKDMKVEYQKRQNGKPIKLNTHCVLQPAFDYYRQEQHLDWLFEPFAWNNQPDTVKVYDFYYDYDDELPVLQSKYEVVKKYDNGEFLLLKRK